MTATLYNKQQLLNTHNSISKKDLLLLLKAINPSNYKEFLQQDHIPDSTNSMTCQ